MKIYNEELISILDIEGEHRSVKITAELDRKRYKEVNEVLERLGGKWNRKAKAHLFQVNPKPLIDAYLATGKLPEKNPTAFFPTPKELSEAVLNLSGFSDEYFGEDMCKMKVLEPSGGVGGLADTIMEISGGFADLDVVEILDINQRLLKSKGYEPICKDFMEYNKDYSIKYDYILMNPPFSLKGDRKAYITHINHAFEMLNWKGVLAAIVPVGFLHNETKKDKEFLELIAQCGSLFKNPKNSFKDSGTTVDTFTIVISKAAMEWRKEEYQEYFNYHVWHALVTFNNTCEYHNPFYKKVVKDSFLENHKTVAKKALLNMIEKEKGKEYINIVSVEYIDNMVDALVKEAMQYRKENGYKIKQKEKPINNFEYDKAQIEIFNTGSLF